MRRHLNSDHVHLFNPITYSTTAKDDLVHYLSFDSDYKNWSCYKTEYGLNINVGFLRNFILHNNGLEFIHLDYIDLTLAMNDYDGNKYARNSLECHKYVFSSEFNYDIESIVNAHDILMKDVIGDNKNIVPELGLRKTSIIVGNENDPIGSATASPKYIKRNLDMLLDNTEYSLYRDKETIENLLRLGIEFYFNFEVIHPFNDGNGRIGRILLLKVLSDTGRQPFYFSKTNRNKHMKAFAAAKRGNKSHFSNMFIKEYRYFFEQEFSSLNKDKIS